MRSQSFKGLSTTAHAFRRSLWKARRQQSYLFDDFIVSNLGLTKETGNRLRHLCLQGHPHTPPACFLQVQILKGTMLHLSVGSSGGSCSFICFWSPRVDSMGEKYAQLFWYLLNCLIPPIPPRKTSNSTNRCWYLTPPDLCAENILKIFGQARDEAASKQ